MEGINSKPIGGVGVTMPRYHQYTVAVWTTLG